MITLRAGLFFMVCATSLVCAQLSIYSHKNAGDACWIDPCIMIKNNGTQKIDLREYTLDYYFYDTRYNVNQFYYQKWYFSGRSTMTLSFNAYPPFTNGPKKANFRVRITFTGTIMDTVLPNGYAELEIGIRDYFWSNQNQDDDWSYMAGSTYQFNDQIVIRDKSGKIIFGREPGQQGIQKYPVAVNWIGYWTQDSIELLEAAGLLEDGDAYFNKNDHGTYVYYGTGGWQKMIDTSENLDILNGFTLNGGNLGINMNGGLICSTRGIICDLGDYKDILTGIIRLNQYSNIVKPTSATDPVGGDKGALTVGELGGQWYIFVKVSQDPNLWKRVPLQNW